MCCLHLHAEGSLLHACKSVLGPNNCWAGASRRVRTSVPGAVLRLSSSTGPFGTSTLNRCTCNQTYLRIACQVCMHAVQRALTFLYLAVMAPLEFRMTCVL